jgi:hypothetical protein
MTNGSTHSAVGVSSALQSTGSHSIPAWRCQWSAFRKLLLNRRCGKCRTAGLVVKTSRSKRWWVAPHSLTNANCTFCALNRALAPYQRLVAVSNGLQQHSVISVCIVGGPSASFAILAQTSVMCGCCSGATRNGAAAGSNSRNATR